MSHLVLKLMALVLLVESCLTKVPIVGNPFLLIKNGPSKNAVSVPLGRLRDHGDDHDDDHDHDDNFLSSDLLEKHFMSGLECNSVIFYFDITDFSAWSIRTRRFKDSIRSLKDMVHDASLFMGGYIYMIHRYENDRNFRASFVAHMQKKCSPSVIIDDIDSVASLVKALPNLMVTGRDKTFKIVRLVSTEESRLANIIFSEMLDAISVFLRSHYKSNSLNPSYVICVSSERQYSSSRSRFYSLENDVSRWPENPLDIMSDNEDDYLDDFLLWVIYYLNDGILVFLLAMFVTLPFIIFAFYMLFSIQAPIRIGKME